MIVLDLCWVLNHWPFLSFHVKPEAFAICTHPLLRPVKWNLEVKFGEHLFYNKGTLDWFKRTANKNHNLSYTLDWCWVRSANHQILLDTYVRHFASIPSCRHNAANCAGHSLSSEPLTIPHLFMWSLCHLHSSVAASGRMGFRKHLFYNEDVLAWFEGKRRKVSPMRSRHARWSLYAGATLHEEVGHVVCMEAGIELLTFVEFWTSDCSVFLCEAWRRCHLHSSVAASGQMEFREHLSYNKNTLAWLETTTNNISSTSMLHAGLMLSSERTPPNVARHVYTLFRIISCTHTQHEWLCWTFVEFRLSDHSCFSLMRSLCHLNSSVVASGQMQFWEQRFYNKNALAWCEKRANTNSSTLSRKARWSSYAEPTCTSNYDMLCAWKLT